MRILCLHGYGMNPEVMKHQMLPLIKLCDPSWEFHFLAGKIQCPPAPGAQAIPGPYLCYSTDFAPASLKAAQDSVHEAIETRGPFDGVFGFSQGTSILIAYLLEQAATHPEKPLPVQFAIFCSAVPILAADPVYCQSIYGSLSPEDQQNLRSAQYDQLSRLPVPTQVVAMFVANVIDIMKPMHRKPRTFFLNRPMSEVPSPLYPDLFQARLNIPTLHVRAKREPPALKECAMLAESFCHPVWRQTLEHSIVHGLPRSQTEVMDLASAMKQVAGVNPVARL